MIIQLFAKLKAAEAVAEAAVKAAEDTYLLARRANPDPAVLAPLDPGRHQVALGAVRTALHQVETILGPEAAAAAKTAVAQEISAATAVATATAAEKAAELKVDQVAPAAVPA